jgi:outer membrane receptor protein involved in Fe transport
MTFKVLENFTRRLKMLLPCLTATFFLQAQNTVDNQNDSVTTYGLDELVVTSSNKETNALRSVPGAATFLSPLQVKAMNIYGIKDLSSVAPNVFIPDYGSRLTVPVYVRGFGERSTGQTIGLYVDEAPYPDKSAFDFNFADIQRIEILRGPQGTLFGRNAMGGIVRVYTHSPLDYSVLQASLTGGNYGLFRANLQLSKPLGSSTGLSLNAGYDRNSGYFVNDFSGKTEDASRSASAGFRLDQKLAENWTARLSGGYDYVQQGAFPYGEYTDGQIANPNYNHEGSYERRLANVNLNIHYGGDKMIFNTSTSWQHLKDAMRMDLDYSPRSMYTILQEQKLNAFSEEMTLKSTPGSDYQWVFGLYGFHNGMHTSALTSMRSDAVSSMLTPMFNALFQQIHENNPMAPEMSIDGIDSEIPLPGKFKTPSTGAAFFHQYTINNLLVEGLSFTQGIRFDYEKVSLDYDAGANMNMTLNVKMTTPPITVKKDTMLFVALKGAEESAFSRIIPRMALKYEFAGGDYVYASVSSGYKAGGYNIQSFADLTQQALRDKYARTGVEMSISDSVLYNPEYSWNYELGFKGEWLDKRLYGEASVFYMDVYDMQLTEFVTSGQGRTLSNAGRAWSTGFDVSLAARMSEHWSARVDYGFNHAVFGKNEGGDNYEGKYLPYAPRQTLSAAVIYSKKFKSGKLIDHLRVDANYLAAGKIYWTAANDISQPFYGLLNLRAGVTKGIFEMSVWSKNTLNTEYAAFYFESMGRSLAQKGRPLTFGLDFTVKLR